MFFIQSLRAWWADRGRRIFRYHDGGAWRRADPVWVGNRLEEACPEYQDLLDVLAKDLQAIPAGALRDSVASQKRDAAQKLARAARSIFGLLPLSEKGRGGVTDGEAIGVITQYFLFMEEIARESELFRTSPGPESSSPPV